MLKALCLLGVVLGGTYSMPEQAAADDTATGDFLRVMTFNIRYDNPQDGPNAWPERRDWVADLVKSTRPDLMGLQEALPHQIAELEERLPEYDWYGVGRDDGKQQGEFVPIFYRKDRFDVLEKSSFWLSKTPDEPGSKDWDASITRVTSWVKLRDRPTGRLLFHFNTHFDHRGEQARAESARLLLTKIRALSNGLPVLLSGDFNCTPNSPPYQILTARTDEGQAAGEFAFRDARDISTEPATGPNSTWNGFRRIVPGVRIDFLFVSPGVRVRTHQILDGQRDGRFPSDHLPVVADVELPDATK